jgi:PBSX family phage terminase large subunit
MTNWVFSPKGKRSIREATKFMNVWHGAVRSGKTICSIIAWLLFIRYLIKHDIPGDLVMVGKTERTLKRNILGVIRWIVGRKGYDYRKGQGELFLWGRLIYVTSANDERSVEKIQGMTAIGGYGDEVVLWPEEFFNMFMSRLSLPNARAFLTMNPGPPFHWFKVRFLDVVNDDIIAWHFGLEDNPALDAGFIRRLKSLYAVGSLFYKRFILGLWVAAEGAIYDFYDSNTHRLKTKPTQAPDTVDLCLDYGTTNPLSCGVFYEWRVPIGKLRVMLERTYYYDSSRELKQLTDSEYADRIDEEFSEEKKIHRYIIVDPSAASFILELKRRGWNVRKADNDVLDGIKVQAKMLKNGEYALGPDPSNDQAEKDYFGYLWDAKAQEKGEDKPFKGKNDGSHTKDMERYRLYTFNRRLHIGWMGKPK